MFIYLLIINIFRRNIAIIKEEFNPLLTEQDFFGTKEQCNKILSFIADEKLKEQINLQFSKYQNSTQRWEALTAVIENNHKRVNINNYLFIPIIIDIMYYYLLMQNVIYLLKAYSFIGVVKF